MLSTPGLGLNHTIVRQVALVGLCVVTTACAARGAGTASVAAAVSPLTSAQSADPNPAPPDPNLAATGGAVSLVLDPSNSSAAYHAHEQLVGRSLPSEAVGTSTGVSGSLVLGADGSIQADQSSINVDLSRLQSDESRRDNFIKSNTLQTTRYPTATFVPRQATGLPSPLPTSGSATFELSGDLTVHGVTRPVTWQVTAQFADTSVSGSATTAVNISDFGMTPPQVGPVLSIADGLTLELDFTAQRQA